MITNYIDEFETYLNEVLINENKECSKLYESISYSLNAKGKRFRPKLIFASAISFGINPRDLFDVAVAIEMIHTYSLIHDDLPALDDDKLRRGVATNHIVYGEDYALLAGDNLQSLAFSHIYKCIEKGFDIKLLAAFATSCKEMVEGQSLDIDENYKTDISKLETVHLLKTGALIKFCVACPLFYTKDYSYYDKLIEYGENIGIAFQIMDDILDYKYSDEELGKSNSDALNDKATYISFVGIQKSEDLLAQKIENARNILSSMDIDTKELDEICEFNLKRIK